MKTKTPFAETMREATASAHYRKVQSEMKKLIRTFSKVRHVHVTNPDEQTIQMLTDEGFVIEKTPIKEYNQFKVSW